MKKTHEKLPNLTPRLTPGNRLRQGTTSECIETTPVPFLDKFLPVCPEEKQLLQGTNQCIDKVTIITHHNAAGGNGDDRGLATTLDASGNIYVTGNSDTNDGTTDMVIWKYKSDGTLDTNFASGGIVTHNNAAGGDSDDGGYAITLDALGNIYVTGSSRTSRSTTDMVIWKYKSDGTLDADFGSDGIVTHNNAAGGNHNDEGYSIVLDVSGNIYVGGSSNKSSSNYDMVIWKYKSDGTLDTDFASGGIAVNATAHEDHIFDITLDSLGNIYAVGWYNGTPDIPYTRMAILKYKNDGTLDTDFDLDGEVTYSAGEYDMGRRVTLDELGNIYVTGVTRDSSNIYHTIVWKYKSDGTLDADFGSDGIIIAPGDYGSGIISDGSDSIYVSAQTWSSDNGGEITILKYKNDGTLDANFDSDGIATSGFSGNDYADYIALDIYNNIYVSGRYYNSDGDTDMILMIYR